MVQIKGSHFPTFLPGKKFIHYYLDKTPCLNIWCDVTDTNQPIALVNVILCADKLMAVHTADIKITHPTLCNATWLFGCLENSFILKQDKVFDT